MNTPQTAPASYPIVKVLIAGIIAIALSIVANLIVRWVGMLIIDVPADLQPLATTGPILMFTALFIAVATLVWFIITRVSRTPVKTWTTVVIVGFIVSIIPDISLVMMEQPVVPMGTFTWGAAAILIAMHVVSGVITWWALPRFSQA